MHACPHKGYREVDIGYTGIYHDAGWAGRFVALFLELHTPHPPFRETRYLYCNIHVVVRLCSGQRLKSLHSPVTVSHQVYVCRSTDWFYVVGWWCPRHICFLSLSPHSTQSPTRVRGCVESFIFNVERRSLDKPWSQVPSLPPPRCSCLCLMIDYRAYNRVQLYLIPHCSSIFHRIYFAESHSFLPFSMIGWFYRAQVKFRIPTVARRFPSIFASSRSRACFERHDKHTEKRVSLGLPRRASETPAVMPLQGCYVCSICDDN